MMKNMATQLPAWELNDIDLKVIELALREDLGQPYRDITTHTLFPPTSSIAEAHIISKHEQPIVVCGLPVIKAALAKIGGHCRVQAHYGEGEVAMPGATLFTLIGERYPLLMVERVLLNFLQHLCAIATLTATYVKCIQHTATRILDTRKTLPGFRHLEKYAVSCGGGVNHRMGLYDAVMIKDTHVDWLGGMQAALQALPSGLVQQFPVIVEVRNKEELTVVLEQGLNKISRVLLDNMSLSLLSACVALCQGKMATEASGNVNLDTVKAVAECGVDFISIGRLTHSAGNVDLSMKCDR